MAAREKEGALPMEALLGSISPGRVHRPQGTAVYLTAFSDNAPNCLLHNLKHNEVLHEHVVLLTVEVPDEPYVPADQRAEVTHLGKGVHRVVLRYGFMEQPDVPRDLAAARRPRRAGRSDAHLLLRRPQQLRRRRPALLPRWQQKLFLVLARFASAPPTSSACRPTAWSSWAAGSRSRLFRHRALVARALMRRRETSLLCGAARKHQLNPLNLVCLRPAKSPG